MHLRRTAQARFHSVFQPPIIQNGNWKDCALISRFLFFFIFVSLALIVFLPSSSRAQVTDLQNERITIKNTSAGAREIYNIFFEVHQDWPSNGRLLLTFPAGFDISEVLVANNRQGLTGGLRVSIRDLQNNTLTVERDGTGQKLSEDDSCEIRIAIVGNPTLAGKYTIVIDTYDSVNQLERGSAEVTIAPAPLDHFMFSQIGAQIANQNIAPAFTLTAKDEYDNNVALSDTVFLSESTGTLTPKFVIMNTAAITINNARIARGQPGVVINARAGTSQKVGASNAFNVNELKILSIDTAPDKVSPGQQNIEVNMLAQNVGPDMVTLTSAQLNFKRTVGGASENAFYSVLPPSLSLIAGASVKTLKFSVAVNANASLVSVDIDGSVIGSVAGGTVSDNAADTKDSWIVQTSPSISYASSPGLTPNDASVGGFYEFQVSVQNAGQATLELKPDSTTITFNDASNDTFRARLDANRGSSLAGNGTAILTFRRGQIPPALEQTRYGPTIKLIGAHNGVRYEQTFSLSSLTLKVNAAPQLQIQSIAASQDTVIKEMRKPWAVTLMVKNNSPAPVTLQRTELSLVKLGTGGGTDTSYTIIKPATFKNSGTTLGANQTGELEFQITKTGLKTGISAVFAQVFVSGVQDPAVSNGTQKSILVQKPAVLNVALRTSQATVTAGQTKRWDIIMKVENTGESEVRPLFKNDPEPGKITRTILGGDYDVEPQETDVIIPGNGFKDIIFNVTKTGTVPGNSPTNITFTGQVFAREANSDSVHFAASNMQILVQPRDSVTIVSVELDSVFNRSPVNSNVDTVNVGQSFKVKVGSRSTVPNAEKVDSVRVRLTKTNSNDVITNNLLTLNGANGFLTFEVTAGAAAADTSQFSAQVVEAYSANTRDKTVKVSPVSRSVTVYKQSPAQLRVEASTTSITNVRFGSTQPPWTINCIVSNSAAANNGSTIIIDSSKVTIRIKNVPQYDYVIRNLKTPATLSAGQKDTLKYQVVQTGYTGGQATLTVTLFGHDKNTRAPISANGSKNFAVESSALVKILRTDFAANVNRVTGSEIALVNTAQKFKIEVTVENTGLEVIDTAYVSLLSSGPSTVSPLPAKAIAIATNGGTAKAIFNVTAASVVNALGETFTARLGRVVTKGGGLAARGANGDTTAVARIELPVRLQLSLVTADGATTFSRSQPFKVRARVKNLGQAQTDRSGRLELTPPQDYRLVNNDPIKNFAAGDSIEWNLQAPSSRVGQKDVFMVKINAQPLDQNSGAPADTANNSARLTVSTLNQVLTIVKKSIVAPTGASDWMISTDQIFIAAVKIQASSNLTKKTITLTLPPGSGYRFVNGDSATKNVFADTATVNWQIQAPSLENLQPFKLPLEAKAFAGTSPVSPPPDSLVILLTENRALLYLEPGIMETTSQNGLVAVKQNFTIFAKLRNTGSAFVNDTAEVTIDVSQTGITLLNVPGNTAKKFVVFPPGENFKEITWQVKASSQSTPQETITFEITQRPLDVNTGLEVLTSNDPATFKVQTAVLGVLRVANFRITGPIGAQDSVLSTDQEFTVSDSIYWSNATRVRAQLILPPGFETVNEIQPLVGAGIIGSARPLWRVRASGLEVSNAEFKVIVTAKDANDSTAALPPVSNTMLVQVEKRADPRLRASVTSPPAATDGKVSAGQLFEVTVRLENQGQALLSRAAGVRVDLSGAPGYKLVNAADSIQASTNSLFNWRIRAREDISDETDLIIFKLQAAPFDTNTNQPAMSTLSQAPLILRTEAKKLLVEKVGKSGGPAANGQKDLPLLRLKLTNPGGAGSSNLILRRLRFILYNRDRQEVVPPNKALQTIRVVNDTKFDTLYGELQNLQTAPLSIDFAKDVIVAPNKPDTIAILGNIADNPTASSFRIAFESGQDFGVVDQDSGSVVIVENKEGNSGSAFRLDSDLTVLFAADPEKAFFNYPNPFQPGNDKASGQGTHFAYNLREASSGALKILTLLGELVWEISFSEIDPAGRVGPHTTDIFWSGHNGIGKQVLNGVYLAILKTKDGKMLTTKVAVLKK